MILLLDALGISADEVFCDVVKKSMDHRSSYLSDKLTIPQKPDKIALQYQVPKTDKVSELQSVICVCRVQT